MKRWVVVIAESGHAHAFETIREAIDYAKRMSSPTSHTFIGELMDAE